MGQTFINNKYKKYSEMNNFEKRLAFNFININNKDINSIDKLDEMFCGKIYDKGNGVIFFLMMKKYQEKLQQYQNV